MKIREISIVFNELGFTSKMSALCSKWKEIYNKSKMSC